MTVGGDHERARVEPRKSSSLVIVGENPCANLKVLCGKGWRAESARPTGAALAGRLTVPADVPEVHSG